LPAVGQGAEEEEDMRMSGRREQELIIPFICSGMQVACHCFPKMLPEATQSDFQVRFKFLHDEKISTINSSYLLYMRGVRVEIQVL
jgi:hypothetical protein